MCIQINTQLVLVWFIAKFTTFFASIKCPLENSKDFPDSQNRVAAKWPFAKRINFRPSQENSLCQMDNCDNENNSFPYIHHISVWEAFPKKCHKAMDHMDHMDPMGPP